MQLVLSHNSKKARANTVPSLKYLSKKNSVTTSKKSHAKHVKYNIIAGKKILVESKEYKSDVEPSGDREEPV